MKRCLSFAPDEMVPTSDETARMAIHLKVGDIIIQTGRKLRVTSMTVNGQVRVQAED